MLGEIQQRVCSGIAPLSLNQLRCKGTGISGYMQIDDGFLRATASRRVRHPTKQALRGPRKRPRPQTTHTQTGLATRTTRGLDKVFLFSPLDFTRSGRLSASHLPSLHVSTIIVSTSVVSFLPYFILRDGMEYRLYCEYLNRERLTLP